MASSFSSSVADLNVRILSAARVLVFCDVETLLLGADRHASASLARQLAELSAFPRVTVAALSSGSRAELQARVGIPGLIYVGNQGLEISGDGFLFVEPTAAGYTDALTQLRARLTMKLKHIAGVQVKDNGLTIRVEASQTAGTEGEEMRRVIHEILASVDHPFHLDQRDHVYEIRPRVLWTKAHAIHWLQERQHDRQALVIYVTDDDKDDETVRALPEALTIRVGGPEETSARYRLEGLSGLMAFLSSLENVLRQKE